MKKVTKKEMFTKMLETFVSRTLPDDATADMFAQFCAAEIDSLDKKAVKAKEYAAKKRAEADTLADAVADVLTAAPQTIDTIVAALEADGVETTKSKVIYRLSKLVESEVAVKSQVVIPAEEGKKARKVAAYALA